eukprot:COSAG05_NODE_21679_length_270_cov_0.602339_1_plen_74_part_01
MSHPDFPATPSVGTGNKKGKTAIQNIARLFTLGLCDITPSCWALDREMYAQHSNTNIGTGRAACDTGIPVSPAG